MNNPDYTKYTLDELREAISSIDENKYPGRVSLLHQEIKKRKNEINSSKGKSHKSNNTDIKIEAIEFVYRFKRISILLKIITLLFGLSLFVNYFLSQKVGVFSYKIILSFPGSSNIPDDVMLTIYSTVVILINTCFIISSIGSYFNSKIFNILLLFSWGLMSIGFKFWVFSWWPTPLFDLPLSIKFNLFSIGLGFKVNLISVFFFMWAAVLIPEMRKEILES